ncbi:MAG: hypothetical protein ACYDEP_06155 [Acidimicrobiales bacterium]
MQASAVVDAGGLLVVTGLLEGDIHEANEVLALDATALLVAEYLVLRNEGAPVRAQRDFGMALRTVAEWFPVRTLAVGAALVASEDMDIDTAAALTLAESLTVPLVTKNKEVASDRIAVLRC